ncbi:hypothetical protein [Saccharibacillus sacchari]|uniref:hypothetical protein n=1 Tax=Saccharibacillus sacchari TaxID=456493 RepID=UPI000685CC36|nr:hypothetical protein [Saccharibacillus sacchari]
MLVLTSFSPILLTYAFVVWVRGGSLTLISLITLLIVILLIGCIQIIKIAKEKLEVINFPINSIKVTDGEVVGFLVAYLLPFLSLGTDKVNGQILLFIMFIFFIVIWGTNAYHFNPLLSLLGYHFYEVSTAENITYLLITKKSLKNTKAIKSVIQLTDYIVLDTEEE